jgi:lysophospholipid hydrolase
MGSAVSGVYALSLSFAATYTSLSRFCARFRVWKFLRDVTYPYIATTSGALFHSHLRDELGTADIQDMWLPYYCSVTNITKNGIAQTQTTGHAATSIGASMSYAGALPPVALDGDMLLDGCYSGNLPVWHARHLGASTIFIVDVSTLTAYPPQNYGTTLSGWKMLFNSINPFRGQYAALGPPNYKELMERLTQATSLSELERAKGLPGCWYVSLPVTQYRAEEFPRFQEIYEVGYEFSKEWVRRLEGSGVLGGLKIRREKGSK